MAKLHKISETNRFFIPYLIRQLEPQVALVNQTELVFETLKQTVKHPIWRSQISIKIL